MADSLNLHEVNLVLFHVLIELTESAIIVLVFPDLEHLREQKQGNCSE